MVQRTMGRQARPLALENGREVPQCLARLLPDSATDDLTVGVDNEHDMYRAAFESGTAFGGLACSGSPYRDAVRNVCVALCAIVVTSGCSSEVARSDLSTTLGIYGHQDQRDLERAMEAFAEKRDADAEHVSRGNDSLPQLD